MSIDKYNEYAKLANPHKVCSTKIQIETWDKRFCGPLCIVWSLHFCFLMNMKANIARIANAVQCHS